MSEPKFNREDHLCISKGLEPRPDNPNAQELSEHLSELRNRILLVVSGFVAVTVLAFCYSARLIRFLEAAAPVGSGFFQLKPGELFTVSLKLSVYAGFAVILPLVLSQVYAFMKPGLKDYELKIAQPVVYLSPLLYWLGISFAYYFVLPPLLDFLLGFRLGVVEPSYGLEHFINLELALLNICGLCFLVPVLLLTLGYLGLITAKTLMGIWRYVVLGAFVIAAIITPTPDPLTMTVLAGAMLILYFVTVLVLRLTKND